MNLNRLAWRGLPFVGASLLVASTAFAQSPECPYDLDGNDQVNITDVLIALSAEPFSSETLGGVLASFGPCPECPGDLNDDGVVNGADLGIALANYSNSVGTNKDEEFSFDTILTVLAYWGNQCDTSVGIGPTTETVAATTNAARTEKKRK